MSITSESAFFRNCDKTTASPVTGSVSGKIPEWIRGTLIRNGPGIQKIGPDHYKHLFDGLAVLHRFHVEDGEATYYNKPLDSDTYKTNMAAQRIVVSGFGTVGVGDPCDTLFGKFKSLFIYGSKPTTPVKERLSDNCNVNVGYYGDQLYAMTETAFVRRVDPKTLESVGEITKLTDHMAINGETAHPHVLEDGTVLNMGSNYRHKKGPHYCIVQVPPAYETSETAFKDAKIIAEIPCRWKMYPCYYHSFGMTTDKILFVEQPYCLSVPKFMLSGILNNSVRDAFAWYPNEKTRIYVVSMKDGTIHPTVYETDDLFTFHHCNAYEANGQIIMDLSAYTSGEFISHSIDPDKMAENVGSINSASLKRYVLPLEVSKDSVAAGENLVRLSGSKATAIFRKDNIVDITAQDVAPGFFEFPRINYKYNGKKYNFVYGVSTIGDGKGKCFPEPNTITKIDVNTGKVISWHLKGVLTSEPVFVPNTTIENPSEDDGVLLTALLHENDPRKVTLLILDAKNLKELAQVGFLSDGTVPSTFHGQWARDGDKVHFY